MIEDPKTRATVILIIIMALVGIGFFAMSFINKAALVVTAQSPYVISVEGVGEKSCATDTCEITMEYGGYKVAVQKSGYRTVSFEMRLGRRDTLEKEVQFELIPYIESVLKEEGDAIFATATKENENIRIEQEADHKQALYVNDEVAAYFSIPLKDYDLFPLEDNKTIAIVEHGDNEAVYFVDSVNKSRKKILQNQETIMNLTCSKDAMWCLFEADKTSLVNTQSGKISTVDGLQVPLAQTDFGADNSLYVVSKYKSDNEEAGLVYYVQKFNPETGEFINIMTTSEPANDPDGLKLSEDEHTVYLKAGDVYYSVKF